jgi:hypothetical protein
MFFSVFFFLQSCNKPDRITPEEFIGNDFSYLYNSTKTKEFHYGSQDDDNGNAIYKTAGIYYNKEKMLVLKALPENYIIFDFYFSPNVSNENFDKYLGMNCDFIKDKIGHPFEIRKKSGTMVYIYLYRAPLKTPFQGVRNMIKLDYERARII